MTGKIEIKAVSHFQREPKHMGRLSQIMSRGHRALSRYGLLRTMRYVVWMVLCYPSIGIPKSLRNRLLHVLGRAFDKFGIRSIPVTVNDVRLYIDPRNYWSLREYALSPYYDKHEISAIRRLIPGEYTFIDVGANFGAWSFSLAGHFSRLVAVEPDPRCYECCVRTARSLRLSNLDIVNVALADHDGDGLLYPCASHIGDSRIYNPGDADRMNPTRVKLMSFDSLVAKYNVNTERMVIKLDAQGAEPLIVKGMAQSLRSARTVILFSEVQSLLSSAGSSMDDYLALLSTFGFMPVDLFNGLMETGWGAVRGSRSFSRDFCFRFLRQT